MPLAGATTWNSELMFCVDPTETRPFAPFTYKRSALPCDAGPRRRMLLPEIDASPFTSGNQLSFEPAPSRARPATSSAAAADGEELRMMLPVATSERADSVLTGA